MSGVDLQQDPPQFVRIITKTKSSQQTSKNLLLSNTGKSSGYLVLFYDFCSFKLSFILSFHKASRQIFLFLNLKISKTL